MSFGHAVPEDLQALRQLWMRCFGDTESYVDLYFLHSFDPKRVFVLREDRIRAMLITFPVRYVAADGDEREGRYLYAVCTDPECRGRGLCRSLMQQTEQAIKDEGAAFACLRAEDAGLAEMYGKMGYLPTFTNRETVFDREESGARREELTCSCQGKAASAPVWRSVSALEYYGLRQLALQGGFIDYPPEVLRHQSRLGTLFSVNGGEAFGAMERYGGTVILKEYLGDEALLPALLDRLGASRMIVRSPGDAPFAMAKALTDDPAPTGYLGLAFD